MNNVKRFLDRLCCITGPFLFHLNAVMARKDAHTGSKMGAGAQHQAPVDQYRKQIGRLETKKANKEIRKNKRREGAITKKAKAASYGFIILLAFLLILVVVYLFLYLYLQNKSDQVKQFVNYIDNIFDVYVKPRLPWQ